MSPRRPVTRLRVWAPLAALALAGLAVAAHLPALGSRGPGEFVLDDEPIVRDDPQLDLERGDDLLRVARLPWRAGRERAEEPGWRPLTLLSLALERSWQGPRPDRFRRTNVLLHALVALLAFALLRRALASDRLALAGAALFALHPAHAPATCSAVGRADVLALLLALLAALLHLRARAAGRPARALLLVVAAALALFLAAASREAALAAPLALVLLELALRRRRAAPAPAPAPAPEPGAPARPAGEAPGGRGARWARRARVAAPYALYALAGVAYLLLRAGVLEAAQREPARAPLGGPLSARVDAAAEAARRDLRELVVPGVAAGHHPLQEGAGARAERGLAAALLRHLPLLLLPGLGAWLLWRGRGPLQRALGLGCAGTYGALLAGIAGARAGALGAERTLYGPALPACLAAAALLGLALRAGRPTSVRARRLAGSALLGLALAAGALRHEGNVLAWRDDEALWRASRTRYPDDPRALLGLATRLLQRVEDEGARREAHALLLRAAEAPLSQPEQALVRARLGECVLEHDLGQAEEQLRYALHLDTGCAPAALGLVRVYLRRAERERNPALARRHQQVAALEAQQGAQRIAPWSYELWLCLGEALTRLPERERDAEAAYGQAVARRAEPWEALSRRARLRRARLADLDGALQDYRGVVALLFARLEYGEPLVAAPAAALREALAEQGQLAERAGRRAEALACLARLERWFPRSAETSALGAALR